MTENAKRRFSAERLRLEADSLRGSREATATMRAMLEQAASDAAAIERLLNLPRYTHQDGRPKLSGNGYIDEQQFDAALKGTEPDDTP